DGDVRCGELAGDAGLALEAGVELRLAAQLGVDQLDGDLALQRQVGGAVDPGHAAAAADLVEAVAAADDHRQLQRLLLPGRGRRRPRAAGAGRRLAQRRAVVGAEAGGVLELLAAGPALVHRSGPPAVRLCVSPGSPSSSTRPAATTSAAAGSSFVGAGLSRA